MIESSKPVRLMTREKKNSHEFSCDDLSQRNSIRKSYLQGIMPYEIDLEGNLPKRQTNLSIKEEQ